MSEILTTLWLNIDNFNYLDPNKLRVNKSDVDTLKQARKSFILKPGICLGLTLLFSRYRNKLWNSTKNYFLGNRRNFEKLSTIRNPVNENNIKVQEKVIIEYRNNNNSTDFDEANKIALVNSRNLSTKRGNKTTTGEFMNLSRVEPSYSEQYFGFLDRHRTNVKKFVFFKVYINKFMRKENVYNKGENFLMKTKLIFIPFIILLIFATYDLALTYAGLYFKYQPLVDEYYYSNNKL